MREVKGGEDEADRSDLSTAAFARGDEVGAIMFKYIRYRDNVGLFTGYFNFVIN